MQSAHKVTKRQERSWRVLYPQDCVKYIEAFRRHYWDHSGVCRMLHEFFQQRGGVETVCELGSGAGTNMLHLTDYGYRCFGYEVNEESLLLARTRAESAGQSISYAQLDFGNALPQQQFDAVVSLFVPISLEDMESLARRVRDLLRPGGLFACMLLALQPEYEGVQDHDVNTNEFLEINGVDVVRMNFFRKRGYQIEFDGVYLAHEQSGVRMFRDRDRYDLLSSEKVDLAIDAREYQRVYRSKVEGKKDQCPPMTYEVLDIFQRT